MYKLLFLIFLILLLFQISGRNADRSLVQSINQKSWQKYSWYSFYLFVTWIKFYCIFYPLCVFPVSGIPEYCDYYAPIFYSHIQFYGQIYKFRSENLFKTTSISLSFDDWRLLYEPTEKIPKCVITRLRLRRLRYSPAGEQNQIKRPFVLLFTDRRQSANESRQSN